jgi:hypothetical protein
MFRTSIDIKPYSFRLDYQSNILTLGSCFSENMGLKMKNVFFKTEINPFGVLYNPISILNSIQLLLQNKKFTASDIFEYKSLWHSFAHSSSFSDVSSELCLSKMNERISFASEFIKNTDVLLITFGTAWVFTDKESGRVVSNCHKLPAAKFNRRRLTVDEITEAYSDLLTKLKALYPNLNVVFSVSPIRHWKDGAHENTISKSTLLLAVDALQNQFGNVHYFPAYELLMDELRDYRFYASDMLHPSDVAVEYIWSKFSESVFSDETLQLMKKLEQLAADRAHRPLHPLSPEYALFKENTGKRKNEIIQKYPFLADRIK